MYVQVVEACMARLQEQSLNQGSTTQQLSTPGQRLLLHSEQLALRDSGKQTH